MITINVNKNDLEALAEAIKNIGSGALPNVTNAFQKVIKYSKQSLSNFVLGNKKLDNLSLTSKQTFNPAEIKFSSTQNEMFNYTVTADSKKLDTLQNGTHTKDFDMKTKYPYGRKSRVFANGVPYLIIPFRWGTPNQRNTKRAHFNNFIPQQDYLTNALNMSVSSKLSKIRQVLNANGQLIARATYNWGDRITEAEAFNSPDNKISKWTGLHYSTGMVRMDTTIRKKKESNYFSFRIITPNQPSDMWIRKGKDIQGMDIQTAWGNDVSKIAHLLIEKGIKEDSGL